MFLKALMVDTMAVLILGRQDVHVMSYFIALPWSDDIGVAMKSQSPEASLQVAWGVYGRPPVCGP